MTACVFKERGFRCVWYQCKNCSWNSHSADPGWSARAAVVHSDLLCPGHRVVLLDNPPNHEEV